MPPLPPLVAIVSTCAKSKERTIRQREEVNKKKDILTQSAVRRVRSTPAQASVLRFDSRSRATGTKQLRGECALNDPKEIKGNNALTTLHIPSIDVSCLLRQRGRLSSSRHHFPVRLEQTIVCKRHTQEKSKHHLPESSTPTALTARIFCRSCCTAMSPRARNTY